MVPRTFSKTLLRCCFCASALIPLAARPLPADEITRLDGYVGQVLEELDRADPEVLFTHGPILGRLSAHGIGVWARTSRPGGFHVIYGTSPKTLMQRSASATTTLARDNTAVVQLTGLAANTRYYYLVRTDQGRSYLDGSFKTLPDPQTLADPQLNPRGLFNFKFEFACGNNQSPDHGLRPSLPTYDTLLARVKDDVDFAILNGDWLYEEARDFPPDRWRQQVGITADQTPRVVDMAPTITGVYDVVEVLDSHRVRIRPPARADGTASYSIGRRSYGKFTVGNCNFYLLDTRSHRQLHDLQHRDKPGLTLLGKHQAEWLMKA